VRLIVRVLRKILVVERNWEIVGCRRVRRGELHVQYWLLKFLGD